MAAFPASQNTSDMAHMANVIWYAKRALKNLKKNTLFSKLTFPENIPLSNGKVGQWFVHGLFAANTTPKAEGTPGTGLTPTSSTIQVTLSQFADFITMSDFYMDVGIEGPNGIVASNSEELGYRGALTIDELIKTEANSAAGDLPLLGEFFSASDAADVRYRFTGADVRPFEDGYIKSLIHPHVLYDLKNDPAAAGFQDIVLKLQDKTRSKDLFTPEFQGYAGSIHGVEFWESSNVTQVSGSPNKWRVYFAGYQALAAVDLAGRGPAKVMRPDRERFNVYVTHNKPGQNIAEPEGMVGAAVSYNVKFASKAFFSARLKKKDAPSGIVA